MVISGAILSLDKQGIEQHKKALEEGYKDEICPLCDTIFLAHNNFVRCGEGKNCPMSCGKTILELMGECLFQPQEPATETPDSLEPQTENPLLIPAEKFWVEEANSI